MIDAHNHLQDSRLDPWRDGLLRDLGNFGLRCAVVNGTRESDWPKVAALAAEVPWVLPSFGLHPWYVKDRSGRWFDRLLAQIDAHPGCGVGEVGLDRWIEGHDLEQQRECFLAQLALAAERNLPLTIHCLKAWGALVDILRTHPRPARGFLLHAYGGPGEMIAELVKLGAYFSFSTYFLHERKGAQREVFAALPTDRLLVETDAPDMAPPTGYHDLTAHDGAPLNHPANIEHAYAALAGVRRMREGELSRVVVDNFARLFGRRV